MIKCCTAWLIWEKISNNKLAEIFFSTSQDFMELTIVLCIPLLAASYLNKSSKSSKVLNILSRPTVTCHELDCHQLRVRIRMCIEAEEAGGKNTNQ